MKTKKKNFILLSGLIISLGGIYYATKNIDWLLVLETIKDANTALILLAAALLAVNINLRCLRWYSLSELSDGITVFLQGTWLGYFFNTILPVRPGEVLRIIFVARKLNISYSFMITKSLMDRMCDLFIVAALCIIAVSLFSQYFFSFNASAKIIITLFIVISGFLLLIFLSHPLSRLSAKIKFIPASVTGDFFLALDAFKHRRTLSYALSSTAAIFIVDIIEIWLFAKALNIPISPEQACLISATLYLSMLLPSGPAQIGVHQAACLLVFTYLGFDQHIALAFSIIMQVTHISLVIAVTAIITAPMLYKGQRIPTAAPDQFVIPAKKPPVRDR